QNRTPSGDLAKRSYLRVLLRISNGFPRTNVAENLANKTGDLRLLAGLNYAVLPQARRHHHQLVPPGQRVGFPRGEDVALGDEFAPFLLDPKPGQLSRRLIPFSARLPFFVRRGRLRHVADIGLYG